ncbi:MAG: hypothetical protein E6312_01250 [Peptoniphilus grossensis]|uniref:DUF1659 domain-containing protein n=1 Tax=Peptoniphilus grossensis TaxID=1465756 RepID=UPI0029130752|nr:hypothetical protein [Peptoniphilus grossensis]MDU7150679.1 hypothetical protein [Peptoniphilus grossensis]
MAVSVNDKKVKLRTVHTNTAPDGSTKRRSITISNIDAMAQKEDLYALGKGIDSLVDGSLASVVRVEDQYYEENE